MTIFRILGVILTIVLVICYSSFFVVDERQKALVLQFGQIKAVRKPWISI
jgi:membrane protease subunit HflC